MAGKYCGGMHNRGVRPFWAAPHAGDRGQGYPAPPSWGRVHQVVSVEKVNENDTSGDLTANDQITMYTCVRNQRDNR